MTTNPTSGQEALSPMTALLHAGPTRETTTMHEPIAYTYEADHHCEGCARGRFGEALDDPNTEDNEGNPIGAVFSWDEWYDASTPVAESLVCGDCFGVIATVDAVDCDES